MSRLLRVTLSRRLGRLAPDKVGLRPVRLGAPLAVVASDCSALGRVVDAGADALNDGGHAAVACSVGMLCFAGTSPRRWTGVRPRGTMAPADPMGSARRRDDDS